MALYTRKLMALVKVAMRGPARYALLDDKGNFFLIYTADAVRQELPAASFGNVSEQELNLANMLIDSVGIDAPTLLDTTAPVVKAYVNDKAAGVPVPERPVAESTPVDLMQQLLDSLAATQGKGQAS